MVIVSELSRLGRSIKEVLGIIERLTKQYGSRLILVKQNMDVNPNNTNDLTNKILINPYTEKQQLAKYFMVLLLKKPASLQHTDIHKPLKINFFFTTTSNHISLLYNHF